jgi:hypothetical protein
MTKAKTSAQKTVVQAHDPSSLPGKLRSIGGSKSDTWNNVVANQAMQSIWGKNSDQEERNNLYSAAIAGLVGIGPKDELEGWDSFRGRSGDIPDASGRCRPPSPKCRCLTHSRRNFAADPGLSCPRQPLDCDGDRHGHDDKNNRGLRRRISCSSLHSPPRSSISPCNRSYKKILLTVSICD